VQHVAWLRHGKVMEGPAAELLTRERMESILELEIQ
jgi:hypothetical protein